MRGNPHLAFMECLKDKHEQPVILHSHNHPWKTFLLEAGAAYVAVKWLREGGTPRRFLLQRFHATKILVSATAMPDCKPRRLLVLNLY